MMPRRLAGLGQPASVLWQSPIDGPAARGLRRHRVPPALATASGPQDGAQPAGRLGPLLGSNDGGAWDGLRQYVLLVAR